MWQSKVASGGSILDKAKMEAIDTPLRFVQNTQNVAACGIRRTGRCT
jgi:hypothetical protein